LANGGRMMIPVGGINDNQYICIVDKDSKGYVTKRNVLSVRYVPLTDKNTQLYGWLYRLYPILKFNIYIYKFIP